MRIGRRSVLIGLGAVPVSARRGAADEGFIVAAASSLQTVLPELAAAFVAAGGTMPRMVFGSSGNLARQITAGAPFELFLSADELNVLELFAAGAIPDEGRVYALGRLALLAPAESTVQVDGRLTGLLAAIAGNRLERLAIANPDHAPYGVAARQALQAVGAWEAVRDRLVLGENVAQAAQFALGGAVDAALLARSLLVGSELAEAAAYAVVDADLHAPLAHRIAPTAQAGNEAQAFYAFIGTAAARGIFARHGLDLP